MVLLDVFIGLFFIYVLLSLFASIIQELISSLSSLRGRTLIQALGKLLEFETLDEKRLFTSYLKCYNTSYRKLISTNLGIRRLPSYLSRDQLLSIIQEFYNIDESTLTIKRPFYAYKSYTVPNEQDSGEHEIEIDLSRLDYWPFRWLHYKHILSEIIAYLKGYRSQREFAERNIKFLQYKIQNIQEEKLSKIISSIGNSDRIISNSFNDIELELFTQYDDYMNRARGWFKRKVQFTLICIGFLIAFYSNADTIAIFNKLSNDPLAREKLVSLAENFIENEKMDYYVNVSGDTIGLEEKLVQLVNNELDSTKSPAGIGWDFKEMDFNPDNPELKYIFEYTYTLTKCIAKKTNESNFKWIGFLLTALAISLGANFWFDLLKRLVNIRNAGFRPDPMANQPNNVTQNNSNHIGPYNNGSAKIAERQEKVVG